MDFLLSLVRDQTEKVANEAIEALAIYRNDGKVRERVSAIACSRNSPAIAAAFHRGFG